MKILILKPSSLGDVVQALPVLRLLKKARPASQIYWWIDTRFAPLLEGDPDLAGIVLFERRNWAKRSNWGGFTRNVFWSRRQRFDYVIDLQCLLRSGIFAWLANGQVTVGLDEPREGARGFYDYAVPRKSYHTHAVDWYKSVLPLLGVPADAPFDWLPPRPAVADHLRTRWNLSAGEWIVLQPGARWINKRWPLDNFRELLKTMLTLQPSVRIAILGGTEDKDLGSGLAAGIEPARCLDLTGQLSLIEMVEWLRQSRLMITNDTGPMHVAAALGVPVIALFGPTEPARTGPYGQVSAVLRRQMPCVPCMKPRCSRPVFAECLATLSPQAVAQAAMVRLKPLS